MRLNRFVYYTPSPAEKNEPPRRSSSRISGEITLTRSASEGCRKWFAALALPLAGASGFADSPGVIPRPTTWLDRRRRGGPLAPQARSNNMTSDGVFARITRADSSLIAAPSPADSSTPPAATFPLKTCNHACRWFASA